MNSGQAGGSPVGQTPVPDSLNFVPNGTLKLKPKEVRVLTVRTSPAGPFRVRFGLLDAGSGSAPADAVLDLGEVLTGSDGRAQVTLTAPSIPTTFGVRASVATVTQTLSVSVSQLGYTNLRVVPSYSGRRTVTEWTATARKAGSRCTQVVGNPPPDGTLSVTAALGKPLILAQVPIGVDLAITLRAGHYIGGCADLPALSESDGNQVLVYASDRPINLDDTLLDVTFGPSDARPEFDRALLTAVAASTDAVNELATTDASEDDVAALLDDMQSVTAAAPSRAAFNAARLNLGWDALLRSTFGKSAADRERGPVQRWLTSGLATFDAPDTFSGQLRADGVQALFTLTSVAGLDPQFAGFPSSFPATWSADSSDSLLIGTALSWSPSQLLAALAEAPALLEVPAASSVEVALAKVVDCDLVAQVLTATGSGAPRVAYSGCDESCLASTCSDAVAAAWNRARDASSAEPAQLSVTATGMAITAEQAEVSSLVGSWVGKLMIGPNSATGSGALSATSSQP